MAKKRKISIGLIIFIAAIALLVLAFVSCTISLFVEIEPSGNVALIPISGTLSAEGADGLMYHGASSADIMKLIEKADRNPGIKAILFEINSPGGSAVASKEIGDAVKRAEKPTYSVIREVGASGGYWIASATDKIIANDLSVVGSIGVISSYIEFAGLLEKYNITYQRLVAGEYKDMGSPYKELTSNERSMFQEKIDKIHDYFISEVAKNRNMGIAEVRRIATGEIFLGFEALEVGLVDALGDREAAIGIIQRDLNASSIKIAEYRRANTLKDLLSGVLSEQFFFIGRGIGSALTDARLYSQVNIIT